jgi:hypothetical protein
VKGTLAALLRPRRAARDLDTLCELVVKLAGAMAAERETVTSRLTVTSRRGTCTS